LPITLTVYPTEPANSYASLEYFKADDEQLKAALIEATEYADVRHAYVGYPKEKGQSRQWPREEAYDNRGDKVEGIHTALANAVCEYAWRALNGVLMPDPSQDAYGQVVKSREEKVGPVSESVSYETTRGQQLPFYPKADGLLAAAGLIRRAPGVSIHTIARS
jgi:hypothetical protein